MAPVSEKKGTEPLALDDCRCPVCLEVFVEPVTLPCAHTFCKACFLESVDKATLCCPLCRKRVSTWARLNARNKTLVNEPLWRRLQTCFPLQCQRRLAGQDGEDGPPVSAAPRVSLPGEVRQEYQDQISKLTEERRARDEEERRASEELIQKLLAEEQELLQEDSRRKEEDERLARQLSTQLNAAAPQENIRPAEATPAKKKKKKEELLVVSGHIEKFFSPRATSSSSCSSVSTSTDNKENLVQVDRQQDVHPACGDGRWTQPAEDAGRPAAKRKSSVLEEEAAALDEGASSSRGTSQWDTELLRRRRQEDEDRRVALLLQKELDQEERDKVTNRRKGSADAYQLRQGGVGRAEPQEAPAGTSAPSSSRGGKRSTIADMFSRLSS